MKYLISLVSLFLLSGCLTQQSLDGIWSFELDLQGNKVPFYMKIKGNKATLQNNTELIELTVEKKDKSILIPILNYDAAFELEQLQTTLKGHWIKYNRKEEYKLPLFGMKTKFKELPKIDEVAFSNDTKMKLTFENGKHGVLTYKAGNTHSSIATETGDYRYLSSKVVGDAIELWGFDGLFSFYVNAAYDLKTKKYKGTLYSGKSYKTKFVGEFDDNFELRNPNEITTFKGDITNIKLTDLNGKVAPIVQKGQATVVQIFGSWCPNCIDETKFILDWKKKNPNKEVYFVIVSFERAPSKKHAIKLVKKTKKLYGIDYPIFIASYTNDKKVSDIFTGIKDFISFPTSIYVDTEGKVKKIHAGFNGPATGDFFDKFKIDFEKSIESITSNLQ